MEKEGLITCISKRVYGNRKRKEQCRFTFERIADFQIALQAFKNVTHDTIDDKFSEGSLQPMVASDADCRKNAGVLEALSIIVPETYKRELPEFIDGVNISETILPITFRGFQWRTIESFSSATDICIRSGLEGGKALETLFDAFIDLSIIPKHPYNADSFHELLCSQSLAARDCSWAPLMHKSFQERGSVWRILEWSLKANVDDYSKDTHQLWATVLAWLCSSPDRRIRDRATKGLVRILVARSEIVGTLLKRFHDVDDDYVIERVTLAAYATFLVQEEPAMLRSVADEVFRFFFENNSLSTNVTIRDNLRLLMELASERCLLSKEIEPAVFRPPYDAPWPLPIVAEERLAALKASDELKEFKYDKVGLGSDFQRYKLEYAVGDFKVDDIRAMLAQVYDWFIVSIADMGYPGPDSQCYEYDRYIQGKYGGGRSKPVWAERIGKKYAWISLRRLYGILSDNLPPKPNFWDEIPTPKVPLLQGVRFRDLDPTDFRP